MTPPVRPLPQQTLMEEIGELVFEFVSRMESHLDHTAAHFDLSAPQALALLRLGESLPMRDLAARLRCDASNITGIVDRLEARHLVDRKPDDTDRRIKNLVLTPKGADLLNEFRQRLLEDVPAIGELSKADQRSLRDLLSKALHAR